MLILSPTPRYYLDSSPKVSLCRPAPRHPDVRSFHADFRRMGVPLGLSNLWRLGYGQCAEMTTTALGLTLVVISRPVSPSFLKAGCSLFSMKLGPPMPRK